MREVVIHQRPSIDFDDKVGSTASALATSSTGTALTFQNGQTFFRTRTGRKGRLMFVGNAVDAGGEAFVTFHVLVNGVPMSSYPFNSFNQALGVTYDGESSLSVPVEIPQNSYVQVTADNSDPTNTYNAFIRLRVEYEDVN